MFDSRTLSTVLKIISVAFISLVSYLLRRRFADYSLSIGGVYPFNLTLHDVEYSGSLYNRTYHFNFKSSRIYIRFHWPTPSLPRWLTFTSESIFYQSETSDISCEKLFVTFWFFPLLFKQTAGPWTNAELAGLRIHIRKSRETPYYIKVLRRNLVGAIVRGDIYRLDDFGTKISFSGLTEANGEEESRLTEDEEGSSCDDNDSAVAECIGTSDGCFNQKCTEKERWEVEPQPILKGDQDEIRISAFARGLHLNNTEGRVYSFGEIDAQFRRNWTADRGSFIMIAKECRWVRIHWTYQREKLIPWWMQLAASVIKFPYDLVHIINYPMTTVNLYVSRLDIVFDEFRIRDAELILQAMSLINEQMHMADIRWQDVLLDALTQLIVGIGKD